MPSFSAKRIAALAVLRYGADRASVREELYSVENNEGGAADLLAALVSRQILSAGQAQDLRRRMEAQAGSRTPAPWDPPDSTRTQETTRPDRELRAVGEYRLLRRLGEGSMGAVYVGYHEGQGRQVAIKVLSDALADNPICVENFYRESRSSIYLSHSHLVAGIADGQDQATGKHYLVREFVDGLSCQAVLDRLEQMPVGAAVHIVLEVARALEYLHGRQMVHRDIKPDNILLSRAGVAKLADMGLLKRIGTRDSRVIGGHGSGTSYYMPYEQATNGRLVDGRSDIYALGVTLYQFLTGRVPFSGETHHDIVQSKQVGAYVPAGLLNAAVVPELDRILEKMLARQPADRYPNASALVADLEQSGLAVPPASCADIVAAFHGPVVRTVVDFTNQRTRPNFGTESPETENTPVPAAVAGLLRRCWPILANFGLAAAVLGVLGAALSKFLLSS